jgi:hypothetical protein
MRTDAMRPTYGGTIPCARFAIVTATVTRGHVSHQIASRERCTSLRRGCAAPFGVVLVRGLHESLGW